MCLVAMWLWKAIKLAGRIKDNNLREEILEALWDAIYHLEKITIDE